MKKLIAIIIMTAMLAGCSTMNKDNKQAANDLMTPYTALVKYNDNLKQWGQGNIVNDLNQPVSAIEFQQKYKDYNTLFINEDAKDEIMLTFDEGYENGYTDSILNTLKEKDVSAVFFITGDYFKRSNDLVKKMIDSGQVLGNHTQNHPSMPTCSKDKMKEEINVLGNSVKEQFGIEMNMFRPPKGEFSKESLEVTKECGYKSVFWSFAYADWDTNKQPDKDKAIKTLNDKLHGGAVYLLHAVSKTNAEILGQFIDDARNKGYSFTIFN